MSADFGFKFSTDDRSLPECLRLFDLFHILTTDHDTVTRIAKEACESLFALFHIVLHNISSVNCSDKTNRLWEILLLRMLCIWK
jgi:hypothetical protein